MYESIQHLTGRHPDFRVKYRFYSKNEGGRETIPFQGYRSDFYYDHHGHVATNQVFMIWPEFEDKNRKIIKTNNQPVPPSGTALMYIVDPDRKDYHKNKIRIGTKGFFMEASRKVAECEVVELIGLTNN